MKRIIKLWLNIWLYAIVLAAGVILGCLICNWNTWNTGTNLYAFAAVLLPIHVLEEWHFPGGFHTMYNLMKDSGSTDCFPMNQLSDMWTNFIGVIFGCFVLIIGVNPVFLIMQLFLCCAEIFGHFSGGIFVYKRFKKDGKKTIYNPGLFTTLFGYIPIAAGILICLITSSIPTVSEVIIALLCSVILGWFSLNRVEKLCKDINTPYGYTWGSGYFSKYHKE
jgi:hypothetical protein